MSKPKLNQPDVEQSTTIEPDIKILTTFNSSDKPETINMNITIPSKMFENIFVTGTSIQPDPTFEEVKKEWEDDGFKFIYHPNDYNIIYIYNDDDIVYIDAIYIWKDKEYDFEGFGGALPIKLHTRLTKTFKALGWEV